MMDLIKESAPILLEKCPFSGQVEVKNLTFNVNNFLSVFSQGDYRIVVSFSEGGKSYLFKLIVGVNVKSDIKSSFG